MAQGLKQKINISFLILLGIGIIIDVGVYAVLGAETHQAENLLLVNYLLAAVTTYLTAFSFYATTTLFSNIRVENIYQKGTFLNDKLPSFLLGFVFILAVAATTATVSLQSIMIFLESFHPLPASISNFAPGWVNVLGAIALLLTANIALSTMRDISRMVYEIAQERDLSNLLTKAFIEIKSSLSHVRRSLKVQQTLYF